MVGAHHYRRSTTPTAASLGPRVTVAPLVHDELVAVQRRGGRLGGAPGPTVNCLYQGAPVVEDPAVDERELALAVGYGAADGEAN